MTNRLEELAARVEAATGPDRQLDADIADPLPVCANLNPRDTRGRVLEHVPRYTNSIDAAMTLAAEFGGQVTFFKDGTAKAFLWQPYPLAVEAKAATPALALTAAALRARSTLLRGKDHG